MAAPAYLPARDADLLAWAQSFSAHITATPTVYGLVAGQATVLAGLVTAYQTALATATNPATRTKPSVAAKDDARNALVLLIQSYVAIVQGYPAITPTLIEQLGLTVRKTSRTPIPAPLTVPVIAVLSCFSLLARFALADESTPLLKRKPFGYQGAEVYYKIGGTAPIPGVLTGMTFQLLQTRTPFQFSLPGTASGETVYVVARWVNAKGQPGPLSSVVTFVAA